MACVNDPRSPLLPLYYIAIFPSIIEFIEASNDIVPPTATFQRNVRRRICTERTHSHPTHDMPNTETSPHPAQRVYALSGPPRLSRSTLYSTTTISNGGGAKVTDGPVVLGELGVIVRSLGPLSAFYSRPGSHRSRKQSRRLGLPSRSM